MSRSKQTSNGRGRSRVVTALGIAGALSLAGGASASNSATQSTAPVILAEEEISDVSLATFYVFDKENAGAHRSGARLAAGEGGCKTRRLQTGRLQTGRLQTRRLQTGRLQTGRLWRLWRPGLWRSRRLWRRLRRPWRLRRLQRLRRLLYRGWTPPRLLVLERLYRPRRDRGRTISSRSSRDAALPPICRPGTRGAPDGSQLRQAARTLKALSRYPRRIYPTGRRARSL